MMGHSHAVSGALIWAATAPAIATITQTNLTLPLYIAGALTTAGAALLPDLDHPQATISRTFGPLSQLLSTIVHTLAGGHRRYTHTILFAILTGAALWTALRYFPQTTITITMFLTIGLACRGLHLAPANGIKGWATITAISIAGTYLATNNITQWQWLPVAITIGCLTHIAGDCCTPGGCPLFLPVSKKMIKVPLLPATGSFVETGVLTPLMGAATIGLAWLTLSGS